MSAHIKHILPSISRQFSCNQFVSNISVLNSVNPSENFLFIKFIQIISISDFRIAYDITLQNSTPRGNIRTSIYIVFIWKSNHITIIFFEIEHFGMRKLFHIVRNHSTAIFIFFVTYRKSYCFHFTSSKWIKLPKYLSVSGSKFASKPLSGKKVISPK